MKQFEINHDLLRLPLQRLLIVAAIIGLLGGISGWYASIEHDKLVRTRADLNVLRAEYRDAVEAGGILRTSQQRYRDLEQRGFIGEEPRLLWIESLRNSGQSQRLYSLKYNLRQQQPVRLNGGPSTSHYQLYASPMELHLDLAHEGRLVSFFENLRGERPAIYQLHACTLIPSFDNDSITFDRANVSADCDLIWFTARPMEQRTVEDTM
ncbi:hypothetical protein MNBD_GAMMA15-1185 [hydrothermal vent metagenome]|uniref:Uncharacterized protein n=1 Tax=hydrothermal vent metagenome TaxID=652676 RepID=A0A3B0Z9S9_9ZZZZ